MAITPSKSLANAEAALVVAVNIMQRILSESYHRCLQPIMRSQGGMTVDIIIAHILYTHKISMLCITNTRLTDQIAIGAQPDRLVPFTASRGVLLKSYNFHQAGPAGA